MLKKLRKNNVFEVLKWFLCFNISTIKIAQFIEKNQESIESFLKNRKNEIVTWLSDTVGSL